MKILRIDLWTLLFVFAFFPALAQAQSSVFRVYVGLAPTSYHITLDIPGAFNATLRDSYTLTGGYIHALSGGVSISGFGGYTYGKTIFYTPPSFGYSKDIFESKGIFVGAGAGVPALRGQFSGSLAIAGMKGNQKDDNGFDIKADTTFGFSLGGAYTYKLSEKLGVTADLRYQQYKYDFGSQISGYKVTEKITSLGVRLGYQF